MTAKTIYAAAASTAYTRSEDRVQALQAEGNDNPYAERSSGDPPSDEIRSDGDYPNTRLFFRWYAEVLGGKNVVVAVVSAEPPEVRHWIVTAFVSRRPPRGDLEWKRR